MVVCCLVPTFRHPLQRFIGERKVNRFFRLLHGYCQAVLAVVNKHIFPLQSDNVTDTYSTEAGEQVGTFYPFVLHWCSD